MRLQHRRALLRFGFACRHRNPNPQRFPRIGDFKVTLVGRAVRSVRRVRSHVATPHPQAHAKLLARLEHTRQTLSRKIAPDPLVAGVEGQCGQRHRPRQLRAIATRWRVFRDLLPHPNCDGVRRVHVADGNVALNQHRTEVHGRRPLWQDVQNGLMDGRSGTTNPIGHPGLQPFTRGLHNPLPAPLGVQPV